MDTLLDSEIFTTAGLMAVAGLLMATSVLFSRVSARFGFPIFLLFIGIGMLAGSEGIGRVAFEDYGFSFHLGTLALALILFDGGLNTPLSAFRQGLRPAAVLATLGVAGTMAVVAVAGRLLGLSWGAAFLLGAIVSSTDAAVVFSVLRASGLQLRRRVGTTLELESGLNDPMAVILTLELTRSLAEGRGFSAWSLLEIPLQLGVGAGLGLALGYAARWLLRWSRVTAGGLYPVFTLGITLLAFALPTLLSGSGFLSVYLAGVVLGNGDLPYQAGLRRFHDAAAWFGQVLMFLLLGLLSFPSRILEVAGTGLIVGLVLVFVARPLSCLLCLLPFRFSLREILFVGWVGLRGAVPIILAIYPVLMGVEGAQSLFNVVFCIVVLSALVPGGTVAGVARRLGLATESPPVPAAVLEISSLRPLDGQILSFFIEPALPVCGAAMADIPFPERASALLLVRGGDLIAPRGDTVLLHGDHVYVFCKAEDLPLIGLLFGRAEE